MIVDGSFIVRQPDYHRRMLELFGSDCVRTIKSHAKFMTITNDEWKIVVRTSMNLNENPRLENLEITEDPAFAEFFMRLTDEIFYEISPTETKQVDVKLDRMPEQLSFELVEAPKLKTNNFKIPETTHEVC